jgi:hypothetical protein
MRLSWLFVLVTGCASHGSTADDAPPGDLICESGAASFPALDKSCTQASDCFVARHMVSCCGTLVALGFNVASESAFTAAETACAAGYPGCGCASQPTAAEDGRTEVDGAIAVHCIAQQCLTFVP